MAGESARSSSRVRRFVLVQQQVPEYLQQDPGELWELVLDCIQYDFTGFSGPYAAPHAACLLCCSLKPLGCHFSHGQSVERVGGASEDFERFRACSSYQNKIENENTRAHPKVFDRSMSTLQLPGAILRTSIHFEHPFQHHKALTAC
ncbi:hypothetical protein BHE74_00045495 [Ensete ventricosum]|nr:hypothetical protein BHE74_00045495 [Ensete ventricosum]